MQERPFHYLFKSEGKFIYLFSKLIFCCVNENLTTFLYTLNKGDKKTEGELVFVFGIWLIQGIDQ